MRSRVYPFLAHSYSAPLSRLRVVDAFVAKCAPRHTAPHRTTPNRTTPHHTTPHRAALHHTAPHHTTPHHITSHRTIPHHTTTHHWLQVFLWSDELRVRCWNHWTLVRFVSPRPRSHLITPRPTPSYRSNIAPFHPPNLTPAQPNPSHSYLILSQPIPSQPNPPYSILIHPSPPHSLVPTVIRDTALSSLSTSR